MFDGKRKAESELALSPERPAPRKSEKRYRKPPFTAGGVVARLCAAAAIVCMLLPWFGVPALNTIRQQSWMFSIMVPPGDYIYPMYATGDVAGVLDQLTGSGLYGSVWSVFLIAWIAGIGLLAIRFVQSWLGYRETNRLFIGGVISAAVAIAWAVAVLVLNNLYSADFEAMFGMNITFFEVLLPVYLTFAFGTLTAVLAKVFK